MKFKVSNKSWILLSTTILIGIAFSVYFLVYVKGKEKEIISNNFRVLQQIVLNIESLKESYQRNAETYYNNLDTAWTTQDDTKINELNTNLEPLDEIDSGYLKDDHEIIFGKDGLIFKVKGSGRSDAPIFFQSDYDVFFNNQLFYRSDIFDQIIISRINPRDSSNSRVLFSNSIIGVLDSAFFQKTISQDYQNIIKNSTIRNFIPAQVNRPQTTAEMKCEMHRMILVPVLPAPRERMSMVRCLPSLTATAAPMNPTQTTR